MHDLKFLYFLCELLLYVGNVTFNFPPACILFFSRESTICVPLYYANN